MADRQALDDFARWVAGCSGNEKQEARTFIEKLIPVQILFVWTICLSHITLYLCKGFVQLLPILL